jgi:hypothetical protein
MDRREFSKGLLTGVLAVPTRSTCSAAASADLQDTAAPAPADQLLALLKAKFGDRLTDEQWKAVRGKIEGQLAAAKTLSEFRLQNSDEPATVFRAIRR